MVAEGATEQLLDVGGDAVSLGSQVCRLFDGYLPDNFMARPDVGGETRRHHIFN